MAGNPFYKIRVITSEELELKLAGRKDFNEIAIAFKRALIASSSRPTLDAAYSIKALSDVSGSETYQDTDNKKRVNTGAPSGLVEERGGIRYIENQKWEEGRSLYLTPSLISRLKNTKQPNFGWLEDPKPSNPDEYARGLASKPKIRFRKYKVNSKTNELIQSSEQPVDQFSLNGNAAKQTDSPEVKRLPGETIGSRGRSLLARAAAAFGVIVDEANKFRCPPGTPAANQFTDSMGSNCFGISSSEILNFALDKAKEIGDESTFRNNVKNFFNFVSYIDNGGIPGLGRTVWRDENGKRIRNIKKWREASLNDRNSRVFVDGMIRGQDRLKQQDKIISDLMTDLDVMRTPERMATNEDLYEALDKLRASGAWTLNVRHGDGDRPTKEQVNLVMRARLNQVPGFSALSPERQNALIKADAERYYQTERAILEAALDSFVADPEHMRSVNDIEFRWELNPGDEANANLRITEDTQRFSGVMTFHIPQIMSNQEAMLPQLAPNERLRIDVVGARTDAEAATVLSDFLVTVDGHSKQLAGMVEERAYARHIAKHEIAHTIQMARFTTEAKRQIETNGFIEVKKSDGTLARVEDVKDLTGGMIAALMKSDGDSIDLESLKNALSRTDVVAFLAGEYPKDYFNDDDGAELWALEALAELHALRDLGIIYGDDIDAALEWMDEQSDQKYITERRLSADEGLAIIKESYYANVGPDREILGETRAVIRERERAEAKGRLKRAEDFVTDPTTTEDQIIAALTNIEEYKEDLSNDWSSMDSAGVPSDDPARIENRNKMTELDKTQKIIERGWNDRFGRPGDENRSANKKRMRELIDERREVTGTLDPEKLKVRMDERETKEAKELSSSLDEDGLIRKLADFEILLKDPATSKDEREKIKKQQKIFRDAFKKLRVDSGDERPWAAQRRELEKKIFDIVVPETERVIAKPKKFKNSRSSGTYARQTRKDLDSKLTDKQKEAVKQIERTEDAVTVEGDDGPAITRIMKQSEQVSAVKEINRKHRKAQRGAAEINGENIDNASLEQQIENVLIPALEAFEQAEVTDNFEVDATVYVDIADDDTAVIPDTIFVSEIVKGRVITEEKPGLTGVAKYADGEDIRNRWGTEKKHRVVIQVAKGDKAILSRGDARSKDDTSGFATLPPGMRLRVVDRREDGTIVARIERQESITDTLSRISNITSGSDEGPAATQHAKGTKSKIDRTIDKYIAQRRENGLSSVPSQPKPSPAIESRNTEATRTVREAGGAFGEAAPDDYVAEVTKAPLVQPAEADIKPDPVDPRTGRPQMRVVNRMTVDELVNRRASVYRNLLDPDYANDRKGFQGTDRATLRSLDDELAKRGEIIANLPQPPDFDENHVPGSKKRAPYKTSSGVVPDNPASGAEALGVPQTREQRKSSRRKKVESTVDSVKNLLSGEDASDLWPDATKDSVDPSVARIIFSSTPEQIAQKIEDAAVEFHEGIDKRPRVRMSETQLDSFMNSGEFLPDDPDDVILESGAIGRRLERRLNPRQRRSNADITFSSGRTQQRAIELDSSVERAQKNYDDAVRRVENLEEGLRILEETGEWKGGDLGVVASVSNNWTVDGPDEPGLTPKNLTADEVAERGGAEKIIDILKEKIRISKIEARHQEDIAKRKKIRREQGVLDVEDIPDDVMLELREEAKRIKGLSTDSEEFNEIFGGAESDDRFVYHAGASELDDGVLDPSRSVGSMVGRSKGPGDTRGLNNRQIEIARETIDERQPGLDALKALSDWKNKNPEGGRFRASSPEEAKQLEMFGLIGSAFKVDGGDGLDYDIPQSAYAEYGYREIDNTIQSEEKFLGKYKAVLDMAERVDGQFLSSYPAGKEIVSGGYFGRFAPKTIPNDIASVASEFERQNLQVSSTIEDRDAYDRWMTSRRGTAWLVDGKEGKDITSLLGPGNEETQILGRRKPIFGISQKVSPGQRYTENGTVTDDKLKEVGPALMARAIKLQRQGKPVTPEAVLSAPLSQRTDAFAVDGFSSGRTGGKRGKVAGVLTSRVTDKIVDAALKRTNADEQTKERVKYGMKFAGALAAGGPPGFAAALAQDVARRAGREIAERVLEEAVARGHVTAEQAELAMRGVDRVAPEGLPDEVVDALADAWTVGSKFMDERVFTEENAERAREIVGRGKEIAGSATQNLPGSVTQAGETAKEKLGGVASRVRGRIGGRRRGGGDSFDEFDTPSATGTQTSIPSFGGTTEYDDPFGDYTPPSTNTEYDDPFDGFDVSSQSSTTTEYDDPFGDFDVTSSEPAKTEYDPFGDAAFSSGKKAGRAANHYNKEYQSRIGLSKGMPSATRPVSGYVVHRSHDEERKRRVKAKGKGNIGSDAVFEIGDNDIAGDGLTAFGEIEVVLRPEVSQRTSYGRGDSLASAHRPVLMNSRDTDDIADALINTDGINNSSKDAEAMVHMLQASLDKNFSSINAGRDEKGRMTPVGKIDPSERPRDPFEAHILGGFKKDEVEGIHYPYTRVQKLAEEEDISDVVNEGSVKGRLEKLGFTPEEIAYFYSVSDGGSMNTPSMQKLREYRAAKKVKDKYQNAGVEYVRIAHPDGINIENPRTYDKNALGNENVGLMLQQNIISEMDEELKKALKKMRKPGPREVVS